MVDNCLPYISILYILLVLFYNYNYYVYLYFVIFISRYFTIYTVSSGADTGVLGLDLAPPPHDCKIDDVVKSAKLSISIICRFIHIFLYFH